MNRNTLYRTGMIEGILHNILCFLSKCNCMWRAVVQFLFVQSTEYVYYYKPTLVEIYRRRGQGDRAPIPLSWNCSCNFGNWNTFSIYILKMLFNPDKCKTFTLPSEKSLTRCTCTVHKPPVLYILNIRSRRFVYSRGCGTSQHVKTGDSYIRALTDR